MTAACVESIIICKLGYCYKPGLVFLLKVNKSWKLRFYCSVLSFKPTLSQKIKYDRNQFVWWYKKSRAMAKILR